MSIAQPMYPSRFLCAVIIALALLSGCRSSSSESSKYKYLQQDQTQIRVDERSGRTDRLTSSGWVPISFDSPSVDVPKDQLKRVYEELAENLIVRIVERYLAEHRTMLQQNLRCQTVLRETLETFITVASASAQRLAYKVDDIFR